MKLRAAILVLAGWGALAGSHGEEPTPRWRAPIEVQQATALNALPLPASAYAHSLQPGLADLRLVDSRGERVPFTLLGPNDGRVAPGETMRDLALYPLPPRPASGGEWTTPVEVSVEGERISVTRRAGTPVPADARTPGCLFDLGDAREPGPVEARAHALRLRWSGPAEFSATYDLETSDDPRSWTRAGGGRAMALAPAPGAQAVSARASEQGMPTELVVAPSPEPPGAQGGDEARRALHFDLGAVLPLAQLDLRGPAGTWASPVQVHGRDSATKA